MIIFKESEAIHLYLNQQIRLGKKIGFVPTMGALHQGHLSLIKRSKSETSLTVCSIFVNPTQFNNKQDFLHYPITIEKDIELLEQHGCDVLFLPDVDQIYPPGFIAPVYSLGYLDSILEGKHRPGHFQGVCMVVDRLLQICTCHFLFLGQKDYQQCMVIEKLIKSTNLSTQVIFCETLREADGLAMSSRNTRLSEDQRNKAIVLYKSLTYIREHVAKEPTSCLLEAQELIKSAGFEIDYLTVCDQDLHALELDKSSSSNELSNVHSQRNEPLKKVALVAASIGGIRLIDNLVFE